jgi:hypothetical protein
VYRAKPSVRPSFPLFRQGGTHFLRGNLQRYNQAVAARARRPQVLSVSVDLTDGSSTVSGLTGVGDEPLMLTDGTERSMLTESYDGVATCHADMSVQGFVGRANKNGIVAIGCTFRRIVYRNVLAQCWVRAIPSLCCLSGLCCCR